MIRTLNGQLEDFNPQRFMEKIKARKTSLFSELGYEDMTYSISVHFEELFGTIDENTEYFIDIVEEDPKGNQRRLTTYQAHSHLKDYEVVEKLEGFKRYICGEVFNG